MSSNFLILFIGLANLIAVLLVYFAFGKGYDKQKRVFNTVVTIGIMYIVTLIVYLLSSIAIEKVSASNTAKTMLLTAFVPVNTILVAPFLILSYLKMQQKKLDVEKLNKRVMIVGIIAIIVLVSEFFYFRSFQKGLIKTQQEINNAIEQNELQNQEAQENNNQTNQTNNNAENSNTVNSVDVNNSVKKTDITVNTTSTNTSISENTTSTNKVVNATINTTK